MTKNQNNGKEPIIITGDEEYSNLVPQVNENVNQFETEKEKDVIDMCLNILGESFIKRFILFYLPISALYMVCALITSSYVSRVCYYFVLNNIYHKSDIYQTIIYFTIAVILHFIFVIPSLDVTSLIYKTKDNHRYATKEEKENQDYWIAKLDRVTTLAFILISLFGSYEYASKIRNISETLFILIMTFTIGTALLQWNASILKLYRSSPEDRRKAVITAITLIILAVTISMAILFFEINLPKFLKWVMPKATLDSEEL